MTSTKRDDTLMPELLKLVTSNGTDSMREVFQKLLNEAMKAERAEALGAEPYERTPDRVGYAPTGLSQRRSRPGWEPLPWRFRRFGAFPSTRKASRKAFARSKSA